MDTLEIIRQMKADPALAEEMRAVILDEELRRLPEVVRELADSVKAFQASVISKFDKLDGRMDRLDGRMDRLDGRMDRLDGRMDRMDGHISNLSGNDYERQVIRNIPTILGYSEPAFRDVRMPDKNELIKLLDEAVEANRLTVDEARTAILANSIAVASAKGDGQKVWLVVEASVTIDEQDVSRAKDRASILARGIGEASYGVVVGAHIPDELPTEGVIAVHFAGKRIN